MCHSGKCITLEESDSCDGRWLGYNNDYVEIELDSSSLCDEVSTNKFYMGTDIFYGFTTNPSYNQDWKTFTFSKPFVDNNLQVYTMVNSDNEA